MSTTDYYYYYYYYYYIIIYHYYYYCCYCYYFDYYNKHISYQWFSHSQLSKERPSSELESAVLPPFLYSLFYLNLVKSSYKVVTFCWCSILCRPIIPKVLLLRYITSSTLAHHLLVLWTPWTEMSTSCSTCGLSKVRGLHHGVMTVISFQWSCTSTFFLGNCI